MAGSACDAETLLVSASWNGTPFNVVTGVSYTISITDVPIRNEGKIGPGCRGVVGADLACSVTFLVCPPFDPIDKKNTKGSLVFTASQADMGGTRTCTMLNMTPRGTTYAFDRESPPATYVQHFVHTGDMDTLPITNP
jgi:hypothetical protein